MNREKLAFKQAWNHIDILICTPLKFLKMYKRVADLIDINKIEYIVMDESDKYFELVNKQSFLKYFSGFIEVDKIDS